jgi:tetratricopeptide (TPR) repeat protein
MVILYRRLRARRWELHLNKPKTYLGIMVSSTFTDLKEHRQKVIEAIHAHGYRANVMEYSGAQAGLDVIDSSLKMVRDSAAYVGVISRKYGQTPYHPQRNPDRLSITELEFNEALKFDRPILLFLMGEKHSLTEADIELDSKKRKKLEVFRERAKRMDKSSEVQRVYATFESLEEFATAVATAVGRLSQYLAQKSGGTAEGVVTGTEDDAIIRRPPALAAFPRYLGSHPFVGRASELQTITEWCGPADPNPMLLFEAMGGSGKSILTWEWLTHHATRARSDWAGRFWYSFYEKGTIMADFCREALAYMTTTLVEEFAKFRILELSDRLVAELDKRPWLIVLDGLERILVAYHRHDAAQLLDEDADTTPDQIASREPCAAIRSEDDDLLRRMRAVIQSKILVSSRLTPQALMNPSGMPLPGIRREILSGLRPADAEAMIRHCGVVGRSEAIQAYLQTNCDCHPLVIGALAGLINGYPSDRGNFDRWAEDPHYGGALDLANLSLVQRRNHILRTAIDALASESRQLLQTLALLQAGADFETLKAFNPHMPPEPKSAGDAQALATFFWSFSNRGQRAREKVRYDKILAQRQKYLDAVAAWKSSDVVRAAPAKLESTLRDLEKRGLLQYDLNGKGYDLHPVVRGIVVGRMSRDETRKLGQKVVDYFNGKPHDPWDKAETLEDLAPGLQVVRVLLRMKRYKEAFSVYSGDISNALTFNLAAQAEHQALLRPFFPDGWAGETVPLDAASVGYLLDAAAVSLAGAYPDQARDLFERSISLDIRESRTRSLPSSLHNLGWCARSVGSLAEADRCYLLQAQIAKLMDDKAVLFSARLGLFTVAVECGDFRAADRLWGQLSATGINNMARDWNRHFYRPGDAERRHAIDLFYRGRLTEDVLVQVELLARDGRNRVVLESMHELRGEWYLLRNQPGRALESLMEAARMAREAGREAAWPEAMLALARVHTGEQFDSRAEAERLSKASDRAALAVAELWRALGEVAQAKEHALRAHRWAVADGEPYVYRYYLYRIRALLADLGAELPEVPRYSSSKKSVYNWEEGVRSYIDKLRNERDTKEADPMSARRKSSKAQNRKDARKPGAVKKRKRDRSGTSPRSR